MYYCYDYFTTISNLGMSCSQFKPEHRADIGCSGSEQMLRLGEGAPGCAFISETWDDAVSWRD